MFYALGSELVRNEPEVKAVPKSAGPVPQVAPSLVEDLTWIKYLTSTES